MTPRSLRDVKDFGSNAADVDRLLKTCFQRHPVYEQLLAGESYAVLGRKGAGKTAIFSRMTEEPIAGSTATALSFTNYPWAHHQLQAEAGTHPQLQFMASWRYLILISLATQIVEQRDALQGSEGSAVAKAVDLLERFLVDTYGSVKPSFTNVFSPQKKLKIKGSLGSKNIAKIDIDSIEMSHLPVHFSEVNAVLQEAVFTAAIESHRYFVCFDELDLAFSPADENYLKQIAGLLHAARGIFVAAAKAKRLIHPVVFLREDIFTSYDFEEKNKIEDDALYLNWGDDSAAVTLRSMMESRFREVLGTDAKPEVAWGDVFDESELTRGQRPKYDYLLDRTLLRPRDVIRFCNEALKVFAKDPEVPKLIGNQHLYAAKSEYSKYLLKEFRDEIHKHFPEYKKATQLLSGVGTETFKLANYVELTEQREGLSRSDSLAFLEKLFDYSLIGFKRVGGARAGSEWIWKYQDADATFEQHAVLVKVHPGLKESLQLKEERKP